MKKKIGPGNATDPFKTKHVGSSGNLKGSRAFAAHAELRGQKQEGPRVEYPAKHLSALAKECEDKAFSMECEVALLDDTLEEKIGVGLVAMGDSKASKKTFALWDANSDGKVTKMEWRGYIKKIPGCEKQHFAKVDARFATLGPHLERNPHRSPLTTHRSSLTTHRSPLTSHLSPLIAHRSPLITHHSPLITHHSPLTAHLSPLTAHRSPLTAHPHPSPFTLALHPRPSPSPSPTPTPSPQPAAQARRT